MFRLAQQIGGTHFSIDGFIRNHQGFGRSCKKIDPDPAVELPLCFGNIGVSGPDQHIHGGNALGAQSHRCHRLHTSDHINRICTPHGLSCDDSVRGFALVGRGAGDDFLDPCNFCSDHRHVGGSDHREFPAWHIGPHPIHWDVPVAEDDPGKGFLFDIFHRITLQLCEVTNLILGKTDVIQGSRVQTVDAVLDLFLGEFEFFRFPVVEPF